MRIVIVFVVMAILFFVLTIGQSVKRSDIQQKSCVSVPDPNHTIRYNDEIYQRIYSGAPIFYREIPIHFAPTKPSELYVDGVFLPSYVPWFDGQLDDKYVFWRPLEGVSNMLMVDTTKLKDTIDPGYRYFDFYIKPNKDKKYIVPKFIEIYCKLQYPTDRKVLEPDENGEFIPPVKIDKSKITWTDGDGSVPGIATIRPPATREFYIFSYEHIDSPSAMLFTWGAVPKGEMTLTSGTKTIKYKVAYIPNIIDMILIQKADVNAADSDMIYMYAKVEGDFSPLPANPGPTGDASRKNLQLETFNFPAVNAWGWWNPECKPAIYLYPEKKTQVHVTVKPQGYLTYTDPPYPPNGWNVTAYPNGEIVSGYSTYPYLYYESKIADEALQKPKKGYVVSYDELPALFSDILPKMGLSTAETTDFKEYWEKALPKSPYYFVGAMEKEAIDRIEHLTISPKEDTIIRVRLYFEALDEKRIVEAPVLESPQRKGFVVSEWGGLVKTDKNHPFTCSQ